MLERWNWSHLVSALSLTWLISLLLSWMNTQWMGLYVISVTVSLGRKLLTDMWGMEISASYEAFSLFGCSWFLVSSYHKIWDMEILELWASFLIFLWQFCSPKFLMSLEHGFHECTLSSSWDPYSDTSSSYIIGKAIVLCSVMFYTPANSYKQSFLWPGVCWQLRRKKKSRTSSPWFTLAHLERDWIGG